MNNAMATDLTTKPKPLWDRLCGPVRDFIAKHTLLRGSIERPVWSDTEREERLWR